jgi:hypothetical protein
VHPRLVDTGPRWSLGAPTRARAGPVSLALLRNPSVAQVYRVGRSPPSAPSWVWAGADREPAQRWGVPEERSAQWWWCGSASVKCLMAHSAVTDMMMLTAAKTSATRTCLLIVEPSIFLFANGSGATSRPGAQE